jgi:hypothetical protein
MIIIKLMGGLGNQMFQYAFGKRLSILRNTSLKLDLSFLEDKTLDHISRNYELGIFSLGNILATEQDLDNYKKIRNSRFWSVIHNTVPFLMPHYLINEVNHPFNKDMLESPKNSLVSGWWQSEKYFSAISEIIRKDFSFAPLADNANKILANKITSCNSVSVHVRRGDYVSNPETNKFHGTCSIEYYKEAIKLISENVPDCKLFIFSDDIDWVMQNLITELPTEYINHNTGEKAYIDMQLMSLCKHNIVANSSFSWWAAWLNANKDKMVVAPQKWFNDPSIDSRDLIPESWIKL